MGGAMRSLVRVGVVSLGLTLLLMTTALVGHGIGEAAPDVNWRRVAPWVLLLGVGWVGVAGFAVAVLLRPARARLLDRVAATSLLGIALGGALAALQSPAATTSPDGAPGLLAAFAAGAALAAARAERHPWIAAVSVAAGLLVLLVFTAITHPATPTPRAALAAALAGGLIARLLLALRRLTG